MDSYIPFIPTPPNEGPKTLFSAAIDCEMGYTSHGYEMIRLTVVDWMTGKTVLDKMVRPYGKIIDLNTRFSGISDIEEGTQLEGQKYPTISFKKARDEFFQYVSESTILIGHGLENDLGVLRLIHLNVVDTALLYRSGGRYKPSLKSLSQSYLKRHIQGGEHDSAEDAIASLDLVKAKVREMT